MNVLWIMCDQLRYDYLGCSGHPHLKTPNIDQLAREGMRFDQAYVQSTICGPSRMSAYTGRYVRSHGSATNDSPMRVGEPTLGDHLREIDVEAVLIGKTHMIADVEGMKRLGIDVDSLIGVQNAECGFNPFVRDDGIHPNIGEKEPDYFSYLRQHGYDADNPWEEWANSAEDEQGNLVSGWFMQHARQPARVPAHLTETAYITDRTLEFMREQSTEESWVAHVSYIKPHWPYIAAAPYHNMYGPEHVLPAVRNAAERDHSNRIFQAYQNERYSQAFSRDEVRETVIPTYMGLITQIDDEIGRIVADLKERGEYDNTMIIISSDHGDYLGDHWLGEKQMFHDQSVRVPLIIRDPRPTADATRGNVSQALVELIDIAPTLLEFYGGDPKSHILEGRSLASLLEGKEPNKPWRDFVVSEYDYSEDRAYWEQEPLPEHSTMRMIADARWKMIHFEDLGPILFDKENDPNELTDIAQRPESQHVLKDLHEKLFFWSRNTKSNICLPESARRDLAKVMREFDLVATSGYAIGYWEEDELKEELRKKDAFEAQRN